MTNEATTDPLARLTAAMRDLAEATTDSYVASAALSFARLLEIGDFDKMEKLVRQVRDELSNQKTTFNDSFDCGQEYARAREMARVEAQAAVSRLVGLRRPDLAAVISAGRKP